MRLPFPTYLDHLRAESARFRAALTGCDPERPVPTAPDWTAADLLWHLGEVQNTWSEVVLSRPKKPDPEPDPPRPASYDGLLAFFDDASARLVQTLTAADPSEPAYTWSGPDDQNVAFIIRRQAHEAAIHRLDAELVAGSAVAPLDPALALDGVDECLDVMYGGLPPWGRFDPLPHYVEFRARDAGGSVWTQLGLFSGTRPEGGERISGESDAHVVPDPGVPADAVVSGTADDLDAWLWHRRGDERITVTGDLAIYDRLRELLGQPIT